MPNFFIVDAHCPWSTSPRPLTPFPPFLQLTTLCAQRSLTTWNQHADVVSVQENLIHLAGVACVVAVLFVSYNAPFASSPNPPHFHPRRLYGRREVLDGGDSLLSNILQDHIDVVIKAGKGACELCSYVSDTSPLLKCHYRSSSSCVDQNDEKKCDAKR